MEGEPLDLNEIVELGGGRRKRLGDCTSEDLEIAAEIAGRKAARHRAAGERLRAGLPPMCNYQAADGTYCEREADFLRVSDDPDEFDDPSPWALCREHREELGGTHSWNASAFPNVDEDEWPDGPA